MRATVNVNPRTTAGEWAEASTGWQSAGDAESVLLRWSEDEDDMTRVAAAVLDSGRRSAAARMAAAIVLAAYDPSSVDEERSDESGNSLVLVGRCVVRSLDTGQHRAVLCYSHEDARKLFEDWCAELWSEEAES